MGARIRKVGGCVSVYPTVIGVLRAVLGLVGLAVGGIVLASNQPSNARLVAEVNGGLSICEREYKRSLIPVDQAQVMPSLRVLKDECGKSGLYELRSGDLYYAEGDFAAAEKMFRRGVELGGAYTRSLRYGLFSVLLQQRKFTDAEAQANKLLIEYPDWHGGYSAAGRVRFFIKEDYVGAIPLLITANRYLDTGAPDKDIVHANIRLLCVANFNVGTYRESAAAMQQALKLDRKAALSETTVVGAAAGSLLELGYVEQAEELLYKHAQIKPESREDPFFRKVVEFAKDESDKKHGKMRK